jgi:hypothetical protein
MAVFNKGICSGLKGTIEEGGHIAPNSIVGDSLLWKKAQKKDIKNKTSETIKRIIPHRNPITTGKECNPCRVPSRVMSRHHWYIVKIIIKPPSLARLSWNKWNHSIMPESINIAPKAPVRGQGLWFTKWKG